jgi:hypothetical protein
MVANTADGYAIALRTGLNQVRRSLGVEHDRDLGGDCAEYPILHPRSAVVCVAHANWSGKEDEIRKGLMNLRRQLHRNPDHRSEYEFGDIQPRLSSPLWVRIAGAMAPGTLVTATLLRHQGAVKSAVKSGSVNWENAERFIRSIGQRQENVFGSFTHA